ncbi:MAG: Spy/CpxP family protein refolding chaperone [Ignavibacteria bacterium]|nr:Spy/CpxP family protein refolding chaperone [Ignavibacteria bacterium]
MKRLILLLIILSLVLLVSAFAQQEKQKAPAAGMGKMGMMPGMMHGMMPGMMHGEMAGAMGGHQGGPMAFLKLTDEQRTKIQDLGLAHQKELVSLRAELQKQHANMKLEMTADKFNEGKVKSIQGEATKLMGDIAMKTALHHRAVRDLLTPEQKKQFDQRILSGGMMGGGMMGKGPMMGRGGMMGGQEMGPGGMMHQGAMKGSMDCTQCKCKD